LPGTGEKAVKYTVSSSIGETTITCERLDPRTDTPFGCRSWAKKFCFGTTQVPWP
jgi:hypothetical protein